MKKFLSFVAMSLFVVLPFGVRAATTITDDSIVCGEADSNGVKNCVINANTTESSLTITLTEKGGADITAVSLECR